MGNCWPSPVVSPSPGTTKHYNPAPNHWARTEQSKSTENRASLPLPPPAKEGRRAVGEEVPPCGRIVTPNLRIYTYAELKTATKNFRPDTVLGEGGFGRVFKGWVDEKTHAPSKAGVGVPVAVKKSNPDSSQGLKEWQILQKIRKKHRTLMVSNSMRKRTKRWELSQNTLGIHINPRRRLCYFI